MKYFVIVNPTSGRGLGEKSIPQIETFLKENNFDFTLIRTEGVWHAAELAENAARDGFDVIVCASGFDPRAAIDRIDIRGRDGMRLADLWKERPVSHLGITTVGMPNLYFLLGPNTALGHNSVLYMIETQVRHVLGALDHCARHDASQVEPTAEAQSAFMQRIDQRFRGTAWTGCRSWYVDAEGRNIALWVGSATGYRRAAGTFRVRDYRLG